KGERKLGPLQQLLLSLRRDSSRSDTSLRPPGIAQRCWRSLRHLEQLLDLLLSQRLGERVLVQLIERGLLEEVQRAVRIANYPVTEVQVVVPVIVDRKSTRLNSSHISISYAVFS